jgi:hypothetical protein
VWWVRRDHGLGLLPRKLVRASARLERLAWRRGVLVEDGFAG